MQQVDFSILRSEWMISEDFASGLANKALEYLAGKTLNVGMFSKLELPDVPENVALIAINGVMTKADVCGGQGTRSLANAVMAAANDPAKQSIILFFESVPGGMVDGTQELGDAIKTAKAMKPVVGAISGMCASAGIWAGSQCTELYTMSNTDQVGCIGVMARMRKKDESKEAEYEVVYSDLSPDKNAEFRDTQLFKENYLNPAAKLFQEAVISGRGDRLKTDARGVLSGLTFIAKDAKRNGLIDGIMPFNKILQRANYLSKSKKLSAMSAKNNTVGKFVFQALLAAAAAEGFAPVEEGFAMTEEQMHAADAHIANLQATNTTLTEAAANYATQLAELTAQLGTANDATTAANESLATANEEIAKLQAKIVTLGGKPAAVTPNPAAAADPVENKADRFMTSADREVAQRKAKYAGV